ncbi:amidohydrolase [Aestuariivirga sp. YIM B02566]|uniref:Amidohydrolase n=1 Tax=Taklimakanibacter albus TaxID=2800327 RepID=A0ACC5R9M0_9HYPH|nr:amidohydrolase [Aestuariivirga sp. YIM B02566]
MTTGTVRTFDAQDRVTEAIAINGTRVLAVGAAADLKARATAATRLIDLPGATVTPGINDAHAHMEREGLKLRRPSLAACRSIADIQTLIRKEAQKTKPGDWIVTMPIGAPPFFFNAVAQLAEGRAPDRFDLDAAAPDHPIYIPGLFGNWGAPPGHSCLNTKALALNGITRASIPSIGGIEIVKDAKGEPTGVIIERNPRPMVEFDLLPAVPRFSAADRRAGIVASMRLYNGVGTTSAYEGHGSAAEIIGLYRDLWERNELTVRMGLVVSPSWTDANEAAIIMRDWLAQARGSGLGDPWFRLSGIHVAYGGDDRMAEIARKDLPNTGWSGFVEQAQGPKDFEELCRLALLYDLRINTIVGDRLDEVVAILERVNALAPLAGKRWVIQHIAKTERTTLARLARLGVLVTTIPVYFLWKGGHWYDAAEGDRIVPMRTMLDLGIDAAAATDNIPYNPGFTLWTMCERERRSDGKVLGAAERLTRREALHALTVSGARLTYDEHHKGPLTPGFLADLAVFATDPLTVEANKLKDLASLLTIVDGCIVFERS